MALTIKRLFTPVQLPGAVATQYTAGNGRAVITAASVTNTTAGAVALTVHICDVATESDANILIDARLIQAGESYLCPELIGQVVPSGGTLRSFAGSATSLTFVVSGYEVT